MKLAKRLVLMIFTLSLALGTAVVLAQDIDSPPAKPMPAALPHDGQPPADDAQQPAFPRRPPQAQADGERPAPPQDANADAPDRPVRPQRPAYTYAYSASATCSPEPRLEGETQGEVAQSYSSLRQSIGSSVVLTIMPGGAVFDILDGPVCSGPHYWYQVEYKDQVGWVTEGMGSEYWLEPVNLD